MYCATCRAEFRTGIERCNECGGELLPGELPPRGAGVSPAGPPPSTVSVFTSPDPGVFELACSILDAAGVTYFTERDGLQDLFGAGRLGTGYNLLVGPEEIRVPEREAERARAALTQIQGQESGAGDEDEHREEVVADVQGESPSYVTSPASPLPTPRALSAFRLLVVADLAVLLVRWFVEPRWVARISDGTWMALAAALPAPEWLLSYEAATEIVRLGLYVVAAIGLSAFWSWARSLYLVLLLEALVISFLALPSIDYGLQSSLTLLGRLLAGAVVALSFYGPIADAFQRRPREGDRHHRQGLPAS